MNLKMSRVKRPKNDHNRTKAVLDFNQFPLSVLFFLLRLVFFSKYHELKSATYAYDISCSYYSKFFRLF